MAGVTSRAAPSPGLSASVAPFSVPRVGCRGDGKWKVDLLQMGGDQERGAKRAEVCVYVQYPTRGL